MNVFYLLIVKHERFSLLLSFRNCLVGKSYHLKICDFGSDNPLYSRDYFEMESHLLIPIRWMAWESVLMVSLTGTENMY